MLDFIILALLIIFMSMQSAAYKEHMALLNEVVKLLREKKSLNLQEESDDAK